ncbi:hypothetical protein FRC11_006196 [Ceratobasidium sp. 423]|nr:hypothetical protein FRC11_006196 [Ceratobasidium sp. 423]
MIQNIRELAGQNPELIGPLLEQLVQSKPRVMGLMGSNPEGLARLFTSGGGSSSRTEGKSHTICVSGEEKEALDRLENMGFPRAMVIQAYFAFDKNEEQAANYLVENCEDN